MITNQTKEQEEEWIKLCATLYRRDGNHDVSAKVSDAAIKFGREAKLNLREIYGCAIHLAKQKLNAPVLDDVEYWEIIKAQEIMDG